MPWLQIGQRTATVCACLGAAALVSAITAGAAPEAAKNLIVNGNAEQGQASPNGYDVVAEIPGWTRKGNFTVVPYGAGSGFPEASVGTALRGGANFFAGGPADPHSAISQDIDVAAKKRLVDAGKAKAVVAVEVGDADAGDVARSGARPEELPLAAVAGVEEEALAVPPQQIAVVVALARGNLAGRSQDDQFPDCHPLTLTSVPCGASKWQRRGRSRTWRWPSSRAGRSWARWVISSGCSRWRR